MGDAPPRTIKVTIPIRVVSVANRREVWQARARRSRDERRAVSVCMPIIPAGAGPPSSVTFTRVAPRQLDSDNLAGAFKAVRDEVADILGVSDAPSGGVEWRYDQRVAKGYAVEIVVRWE